MIGNEKGVILQTSYRNEKKTENEDVASAENDLVKKSENEEENKNS